MKNCIVLNWGYCAGLCCARLIKDLGGMTATEPQIFLSPSVTSICGPAPSPTLKRGLPDVTVGVVQYSTVQCRTVRNGRVVRGRTMQYRAVQCTQIKEIS
jgi:hypothetical protein